MTDPMVALARLIDVLERENTLLEAMRLEEAMGLVEAKRRAVQDFDQVPDAAELPPAALLRLRDVARSNQALLERALATQGRVIALIARAGDAGPTRYAAGGTMAASRGAPPRAFLTRA